MQANRTKQILFLAGAILGIATWMVIRAPVLAQNGDSTKSNVTSLREERRDTLRTRVELVERLIGDGRTPPEDLLTAREDLLEAEYELATNSEQRIKVLQQQLDNAKQLEAYMVARKHQAIGTEVEVLAAKAHRLAVEIKLAEEQQAP